MCANSVYTRSRCRGFTCQQCQTESRRVCLCVFDADHTQEYSRTWGDQVFRILYTSQIHDSLDRDAGVFAQLVPVTVSPFFMTLLWKFILFIFLTTYVLLTYISFAYFILRNKQIDRKCLIEKQLVFSGTKIDRLQRLHQRVKEDKRQ